MSLLHSTVPLGGGLSSSAALEVCTATLLEAVTGKKLDPVEKALLCQKAEHEFAGVPCGIMDQFISVMGREEPSAPARLPLAQDRTGADERSVRRSCSSSTPTSSTNWPAANTPSAARNAKPPRKSSACRRCATPPPTRWNDAKGKMDEVVYRRARHVIGEIERTVHAAEGIRASNWPTVGQLMYASHDSLRDDYEVSCAELDAVVEIAEAIGIKGGVYGCRMTGGGFGGCTRGAGESRCR